MIKIFDDENKTMIAFDPALFLRDDESWRDLGKAIRKASGGRITLQLDRLKDGFIDVFINPAIKQTFINRGEAISIVASHLHNSCLSPQYWGNYLPGEVSLLTEQNIKELLEQGHLHLREM